jgi:hypothetical protein
LTPICINSEKSGLKQSCHNPQHGESAEASHRNNERITPTQGNHQLKALRITFFNLVAAHDTQKALKVATVFILTTKEYINAFKDCVNNTSHNNNYNKDIAKIIHTEVKTAI